MDSVAFRLRVFLAVLATVLTFSTAGFVFLEDLSPVDALYFGVVTVATVGYGDIHPTTAGGKLLSVLLIATGVGTFLGVVANGTDLLLERRREQRRRERLNTVIGLFFTEVGTPLLRYFAAWDPELSRVREALAVEGNWTGDRFRRARSQLDRHAFSISADRLQLEPLRDFLQRRTELLVRLLENPNLVEHEAVTDVLRAVFHLKDELLSRPTLEGLPQADREHLANDARRAYGLLVEQWLEYMHYLRDHYPYLFSLAARINPFRERPSAVVTE